MAGFFDQSFSENERKIINVLITMCRHQIWLIRNLARFQSKFLSFEEACMKLKYYLCNHVKLLYLSRNTNEDAKPSLAKILHAIYVTFKVGHST